MSETKMISEKNAVEFADKHKRAGRKVVVIAGSFDVLHIGHIRILREAKSKGDVLFVLLNGDRSVRAYKGPNRPINGEQARAEVLSEFSSVDYVVLFDDLTPERILDKIKPDIYCNGSDWGKNCVERSTVEKNQGKIHVLKWTNGFSTSRMIEKIVKNCNDTFVKAIFLDRDGTINVNDPEYVHRKEDFKFTYRAIDALKKISKTDYKIIIITNQSGIGRRYFQRKDMMKLHEWMMKKFKQNKIRIDKIYYCPHYPNDECDCRKPKLGMLMRAVKDYGICLNKSYMIGDDEKDVIMGRNANLKTIKIGNKISERLKFQPDYYARNLMEAVKIILG